MQRWSVRGGLVGLIGGLLVLAFVAAYAGSASGADRRWGEVVPGDTIIEVTGTKQDGFGIYRYDGSEEFPPTHSEARAECNEYDTRVARVRCRTEVRTWYRDLKDLKQALRYAR